MLSVVKIHQRHMLMYESPFMQHWLPQWLGADGQQYIAKANADANQRCHVRSLGHCLEVKAHVSAFQFQVRFRSEIYLILWKLKGSILPVWMKEFISVSSGLTHWGRDKMAAISQTTFSHAFFACKCMTFTSGFTEVSSYGLNLPYSSIGSGIGLAPTRWQAISWTEFD